MSRRSKSLGLSAVVLLLTTHPLPAPIQEVPDTTPPPKPKREMTPRPKPKPNRSFAGNWTGNVTSNASSGESGSYSYVVKISDDAKTVWINWNQTGQPIGGPGYQAPCNRFRETLTWSLTFAESMATDTLRIDDNGNASFVRQGAWSSGDNQGVTYTQTGTFSREGAALALSGPQTTTTPARQATITAASKNAGGLPLAKPVPNKPGFIYNPFDPNSRVLLDVRGKASGTKLIEPTSGRQFVVP